MTKQDAINLLTQKDQLQLLSFYDTLTPAQQENLLAQIEGIDWSLLDVLKTHETVNARGTFAPRDGMGEQVAAGFYKKLYSEQWFHFH